MCDQAVQCGIGCNSRSSGRPKSGGRCLGQPAMLFWDCGHYGWREPLVTAALALCDASILPFQLIDHRRKRERERESPAERRKKRERERGHRASPARCHRHLGWPITRCPQNCRSWVTYCCLKQRRTFQSQAFVGCHGLPMLSLLFQGSAPCDARRRPLPLLLPGAGDEGSRLKRVNKPKFGARIALSSRHVPKLPIGLSGQPDLTAFVQSGSRATNSAVKLHGRLHVQCHCDSCSCTHPGKARGWFARCRSWDALGRAERLAH